MHDFCSFAFTIQSWIQTNDVPLRMQINGHHRLDDYQTRGQEPAGEVQVNIRSPQDPANSLVLNCQAHLYLYIFFCPICVMKACLSTSREPIWASRHASILLCLGFQSLNICKMLTGLYSALHSSFIGLLPTVQAIALHQALRTVLFTE